MLFTYRSSESQHVFSRFGCEHAGQVRRRTLPPPCSCCCGISCPPRSSLGGQYGGTIGTGEPESAGYHCAERATSSFDKQQVWAEKLLSLVRGNTPPLTCCTLPSLPPRSPLTLQHSGRERVVQLYLPGEPRSRFGGPQPKHTGLVSSSRKRRSFARGCLQVDPALN